jgi:hypothetical protein
VYLLCPALAYVWDVHQSRMTCAIAGPGRLGALVDASG